MSSSGPYRGYCVFCEKPILTSDPPEHVMPKWLRRFRPKGARFDHKPGLEVRGDYVGLVKGESFLAKQPEVTTDAVCKECNKTWMSDLETQASQLLPPLIEGNECSLSDADQRFITVWVTKTVMMWQTWNHIQQIIPPSDYTDFYDNRNPVSFTKFFLGSYVGNQFGFMGYNQDALVRNGIFEPSAVEPIPDGYRGVLVVGNLVFEVVGSCDEFFFESHWPRLIGEVLTEAWPLLTSNSWPPPRALDDHGMLLFLDAPPGIHP
jgi:hypothetical protein